MPEGELNRGRHSFRGCFHLFLLSLSQTHQQERKNSAIQTISLMMQSPQKNSAPTTLLYCKITQILKAAANVARAKRKTKYGVG